MRARFHALAALLALAGCAVPQPSFDTVSLPPFFYGPLIDSDIGAINEFSSVFGTAGSTRGNPVEALRAIISVEFLASELNAPRWAEMSPITKMQMVQARDEDRRTLGIAPNAPPQAVINALLRVTQDIEFGNMPDARLVLASPLFSRPPDATLQTLANLPLMPTAHVATLGAENDIILPH